MKNSKLPLILVVAIGVAGCRTHQPQVRLVYTEMAPTNSVVLPAGPPEVLVVAKPAPPVQAEVSPRQAHASNPVPETVRRRERRPIQARKSGPLAEPAQPNVADSPPALEPVRSLQQQISLEESILSLRSAVRVRIQRLARQQLSSADQKALDDARVFLSQTDQAIKDGNLQESMNLVHKADLLVAAIERRQ